MLESVTEEDVVHSVADTLNGLLSTNNEESNRTKEFVEMVASEAWPRLVKLQTFGTVFKRFCSIPPYTLNTKTALLKLLNVLPRTKSIKSLLLASTNELIVTREVYLLLLEYISFEEKRENRTIAYNILNKAIGEGEQFSQIF